MKIVVISNTAAGVAIIITVALGVPTQPWEEIVLASASIFWACAAYVLRQEKRGGGQ